MKLLDDSVTLSNKFCPRYYTGRSIKKCPCPEGRCWYDEQVARRKEGLKAFDPEDWLVELVVEEHHLPKDAGAGREVSGMGTSEIVLLIAADVSQAKDEDDQTMRLIRWVDALRGERLDPTELEWLKHELVVLSGLPQCREMAEGILKKLEAP